MLGTLLDAGAIAALLLGLVLATIGLYGLLRMPDILHQVHAAGLITGPAVILILLATVGTRQHEVITSAVLVILFVLITSPLSTHAIAQAAPRRRASDGAPAPASDVAPAPASDDTSASDVAPAAASDDQAG